MPVDVSAIFREHEILVTGANGFLGKVILGLFLERFPEFRRLHILVRPKAGQAAEERFFKEVLTSPALRAIAEKRGEAFLREKITVLAGDIADPNCGLTADEMRSLEGRVRLIINCAGLVEFFPPVDDSFASNVDGVENVVALAKAWNARLLHVSTCYVCGEGDGLIEESEPVLGYFPRRRGPQDLSFRFQDEIRYMRERIRHVYDAAGVAAPRQRNKQVAQRLTDLGRQRAQHWGWVNTYTYAKSIGEQIVAAEPELEYAIVRPAIVESAVGFPFPGWVEGGRTAAPLILMAMSGLRHWTVRPDTPLEVVPVDFIAASIVTVAALLLAGRHRRVYQLGTADTNPIRLGELVQLLYQESRKPERARQLGIKGIFLPRLPGGIRILTPQQAHVRRVRLQRRLTGAQHFMVGLRKFVQRAGLPGRRQFGALAVALRALGLQALIREQAMELYQPFILDNRYIFEAENIRRARDLLSEADRSLLPWAPEDIDWGDYWINNQIKGVEKWVRRDAEKGFTFKM